MLLPWLNLNDRVAVGPMLLDRLSRVVPEMPPDAAPTAEAIAKSVRDIRGRPVDVSMCWFADRGQTTEIAESEVDTVRDYILAAMLSAISENWYLSYGNQVNASHFHRVFQNFLAGTETVAGTSAMRRLSRQSTARGLKHPGGRGSAGSAGTPEFDPRSSPSRTTTPRLEPVDAAAIFDRLFEVAREADEFEYVCALLRIRGMEDDGWDPLEETQRLYDDVGSLMEAPLNPYAQIRLGLLLYSHLTEVDAIYMILANMVEITAGERAVINPFHDLYRTRGDPIFGDRIPPSARRVVERLKERATDRGCSELVELLDSFFNDAVRNAFFHSDYILHEDEFRSREARFIDDNNVRTSSLKLDVILDLINRSVAFFHGFMKTYGEHRLSYKEPKVVRGRIGPGGAYEDITLLVHPSGGVYGFRGGGDIA